MRPDGSVSRFQAVPDLFRRLALQRPAGRPGIGHGTRETSPDLSDLGIRLTRGRVQQGLGILDQGGHFAGDFIRSKFVLAHGSVVMVIPTVDK